MPDPRNRPFFTLQPPAAHWPLRSAFLTWPYLVVKETLSCTGNRKRVQFVHFQKTGGCIFTKPGCLGEKTGESGPVMSLDLGWRTYVPGGWDRSRHVRHRHTLPAGDPLQGKKKIIYGAGTFFRRAMILLIILSGSFSRIFFRSLVQSPLPVS